MSTTAHTSSRPARRARIAIALVGTVAALLLQSAPAGAAARSNGDSVGFGVAPLRIDDDIKAGSRAVYKLHLNNTDSKSATFTFGRTDIQGDKNEPAATPVLLGGKLDSDISAYDWIDVPAPVTIGAGDSKDVTVTATVPAGAKGGHYAAVIIQGPARSAGGIIAASRIAVPILLNSGGAPPPDIKITDVKETIDGGTKVTYINKGTVHTTPKATIVHRNPVTRQETSRRTATCTTALPGGSGQCVFSPTDGTSSGAEDGAAGSSSGVGGSDSAGTAGSESTKKDAKNGFVELVGEDGARARGDLPTEWSGTWSSLLLPLVGVGLFAMYFLFLRKRTREDEEGGGGDVAPSFGTA